MAPIAIRNVRLFDGEQVHQNATVVFDPDSGLITSVSISSSASPAELGPGATGGIIDAPGHTLLPGLIDAHIHCHGLHGPEGRDPFEVLRQPLKAGVTTVCDMHSEAKTVHTLQKGIKDDLEQARALRKSGTVGHVNFSDLKSSHLGATIRDGWPKPIVLGHNPSEEIKARVGQWPSVTTANATAFVSQHKADGADYIKLMQENCCALAIPTDSIPSATLELQAAVVNAAHAAGFKCYGHALNLDGTRLLLNSGADGLTHTFMDQPPTPEIVDLYTAKGAFVIPTLVVIASLTGTEAELRAKFAHLAFSDKQLIDRDTRDVAAGHLGMAAPTAKVQYAYDSVVRLKAAGVDIVAGSDSVAGLLGTMVGPSLWMELYLYVHRCGFTPVEALRSATAVAASRFGFHDRGVVRAGKRADLVLVAGDVTTDIALLWEGEGIARVWKAGIPAVLA